ncbi:MAG TPA: Asp-tRNA(Asn)/Glu-tRNA(Gln) amidotransferase subunit GatC [Rickettsiales bacterium]|nr:Asp-tRNA(Asn)/Glu-tRNA(Gln) amidotransferase subunit GatC [Rickettsiales bacterium]
MTEITNKDIKKIAKLAKIEVSEQDCENLSAQLTKTISWIEQLNEVDTSNIEPLFNIHGAKISLFQDVVSDGNIADDILKNAKNTKYGYFAVPKVIE